MKIFKLENSYFEIGKKNIAITAIEPEYSLEGMVISRKVARVWIHTSNIEFWRMIQAVCKELQEAKIMGGRHKKQMKLIEKDIEELIEVMKI